MDEIDRYLTKIKGFSKKNQTETIHKDFVEFPEVFPVIEKILNKKIHNQDDLNRIFNMLETFLLRQVRNHSLNLHPPPVMA